MTPRNLLAGETVENLCIQAEKEKVMNKVMGVSEWVLGKGRRIYIYALE